MLQQIADGLRLSTRTPNLLFQADAPTENQQAHFSRLGRRMEEICQMKEERKWL
jgi:hypothetical protein